LKTEDFVRQRSGEVLQRVNKFLNSIFANPIVTKEIKQRTRSMKFALTLAGWLLLITVFSFIFLKNFAKEFVEVEIYKTNAIGFQIFLIILLTAFFGMLMVILTSQAIAKERENQTLDILLSTTMSNFEIVIGKMIAAAGEVIILFFATFPVYALLYLYGLMKFQDILGMFVYIFVLILFYGSLGLLMSTVLKKSISATVAVIVLVVVIVLISYISVVALSDVISALPSQPTRKDDLIKLLLTSLSPLFALVEYIFTQIGRGDLFFTYGYKVKGYQVHFLLCLIGTFINIALSSYFLNPLRRGFFRKKARAKGV